MDCRVTANALTTSGKTEPAMRDVGSVRVHMALQTHETSLPAYQQISIHTAVRRMAGGTTLRSNSSMLEHEGPTLFLMTGNTDLPVGSAQHRLIASAMGVVAIRALHEAFGDLVMGRQRKLAFDDVMAIEAQLRLRFPQKLVRQPTAFLVFWQDGHEMRLRPNGFGPNRTSGVGQMRRMTGLAVDTLQLVFRPVEQRLFVCCHVTAQTARRVLFGRPVEPEDQVDGRKDLIVIASCRAHAVYVFFAGTVTGLTASGVFTLIPIGFGVWGFVELRGLGRVAFGACYGLGILRIGRERLLCLCCTQKRIPAEPWGEDGDNTGCEQ